jgi:hypothetical protein
MKARIKNIVKNFLASLIYNAGKTWGGVFVRTNHRQCVSLLDFMR